MLSRSLYVSFVFIGQDPEAVKQTELSEAPDEPPTPYPGQYSSTPTTESGPTPGIPLFLVHNSSSLRTAMPKPPL